MYPQTVDLEVTMAIIRWEPARELGSLQQEVNRVFSAFFDPAVGPTSRWTPAVDLIEREGSFVLVADLPGVKPEDVAIEVEGDVLSLSGAREMRREVREGGVVRAERASGAFRRQLQLPEGVDAEAITARFEHGVLEVEIPKPERAKPRRVAVEIAGAPKTLDAAEDGADGDRAEAPAAAGSAA
ncbi:Hsp20/alpha crystallin family protein [Patulibacter sp. SYSU D01012]|uniref:Hsp20/alpha crystallin family protein n=1 Tax=Patulibacter sp. SYSU D01012 TaxID=2817381 RepID=UPI001B308070